MPYQVSDRSILAPLPPLPRPLLNMSRPFAITHAARTFANALPIRTRKPATAPDRLSLLDLPLELRLEIYSEYLKHTVIIDAPLSPSRVHGLPASRWHGPGSWWTPPDEVSNFKAVIILFSISKSIRNEAMPVFYRQTRFVFVGCDFLNASSRDSVWFQSPSRFGFTPGYLPVTTIIRKISLNMTHSSSNTGQWAGQLSRQIGSLILHAIVHQFPNLRSLHVAIDKQRYDVFDSVHVFAGFFLRAICKLRRLTFFELSGSDKDSIESLLAIKAVDWVLNKHLQPSFEGIDTSTYDLEPDAKTDEELRQLVGWQMLTYPDLKKQVVLYSWIDSELRELDRRMH